MKKIFGLLTALLVAVACMTFTSCATDNDGEPAGPSLTGWFISGDFNGWGPTALTQNGAVYTATFTASGITESDFMVRNDDWSSKYCNATQFTVGVPAVLKAGGGNAHFTGLEDGESYTVTVASLPAFVTVTITKD